MRHPLLCLAIGIAALHSASAGPKPIEFDFVAPDNPATANPYSRELWAQVTVPSGQTLNLPAYYADGGLYSVRARPDEIGTYRFGDVTETTLGENRTGLVVSLASPREVQNSTRTRLPAVGIDPKNPRRFLRSDGLPYVPVGANLAWSPDDVTDGEGYYDRAFGAFSRANLNWMRIWMAHWDGLNLDWLPASMGPSPRPGMVSEEVARRWDHILETAEENGVYVQVVLQHHGQYTTANDSNWAENPWNIANPGGFLKTPDDFFTDPNARVITLVKYRYIVARWGWSPAVVAWELFNEVHWTDAMRHGKEAEVARWHSDAANCIRLVDVYGHLITTSTENLRSPIYEKMDFYQPHMYAANLLAGARSFDPAPSSLSRPVFYGEVGDDHAPVSDEVKKAGVNLVTPVWASAMGEGLYPAQPWDGWKILLQNRQDELGAVFRFIAINRVAARGDLSAFSAPVECAERVPLRIFAGQFWQKRPSPSFVLPLDGTEPLGLADIPSTLAGSAAGRADGYPGSETFRMTLPKATVFVAHVFSVADAGGSLQASVDGKPVAAHRWAGTKGTPEPAILPFPVPAGTHTVMLEGTGPDWIGISSIDTGLDTSALGFIGRRNENFIEGWAWNRPNLYLTSTYPPVAGIVAIPAVPAGSWKITWWDTKAGTPGRSETIRHPGGTLRLPTPPIDRHAAVALSREN